jgi:hypothetical protein
MSEEHGARYLNEQKSGRAGCEQTNVIMTLELRMAVRYM